MNKKITLIVLAGGNSLRFGSNKLLSVFKGKRLFEHMADAVCEKDAIDVVFVTQYREIYDYCKARNTACVLSPECAGGISNSIKAGLQYIGARDSIMPDNIMFSACDQPFLTEKLLTCFYEKYIESGKGIGSCCTEDHPSNPTVFSAAYYDQLMNLSEDRGGRTVINKNSSDCFYFTVPSSDKLHDIDYKEQLDI